MTPTCTIILALLMKSTSVNPDASQDIHTRDPPLLRHKVKVSWYVMMHRKIVIQETCVARDRVARDTKTQLTPPRHTKSIARHTKFGAKSARIYVLYVCLAIHFFACLVCMYCGPVFVCLAMHFLYVLHVYIVNTCLYVLQCTFCMYCMYVS